MAAAAAARLASFQALGPAGIRPGVRCRLRFRFAPPPPLEPCVPASPGMPKLHLQKVCIGRARAVLRVFLMLLAESVRRHAAGGRRMAKAGEPPEKQKAGGGAPTSNLFFAARSVPSNIQTFSASSIERALGCSLKEKGEQMFAHHRTCKDNARNFLFEKDTQSSKHSCRVHRQKTE